MEARRQWTKKSAEINNCQFRIHYAGTYLAQMEKKKSMLSKHGKVYDMVWMLVSPQNLYVELLTISTLECDCI